MPSALPVCELVGSPRMAFTSSVVMPLWIFCRLSSVRREQAVTKRSAAATRKAVWGNFIGLPVALAHDEIEAAENRDHVAHHVAGQKFAEDAQVDEGGCAYFQSIRHA